MIKSLIRTAGPNSSWNHPIGMTLRLGFFKFKNKMILLKLFSMTRPYQSFVEMSLNMKYVSL